MDYLFKYYHSEKDTSGIVSSEQHYVLVKLCAPSLMHNMLKPILIMEGNEIIPLADRVYHLLTWDKKIFVPDPMTGLYGKDRGGEDVSADVVAVCDSVGTITIGLKQLNQTKVVESYFVSMKPSEPLQFLKYPANKPSIEPHRCYAIPHLGSPLYEANNSFPIEIDTLSGKFFADGVDVSNQIMLFNDDKGDAKVWRA